VLNIAVMFGGRSVEHEVSVITGLQVIENMDKTKYNIIPIYVSKEGIWYTGDELIDIKNYSDINRLLSKCRQVVMTPFPGLKRLYFYPFKTGIFKKDPEYINIDVAFLAFHGAHGEDGTVQGFLQLADIPYVGSGVIGSAVGMDKIIMKDVFKANDIPIVRYIWFLRKDYEKDSEAVVSRIESALNYPMFVKPASLGSSIGIGKARTREELIDAIEVAIRYDRKVIVEEAVRDPIEINCSVMGIDEEVSASLCEMPISWQDFLSYDDKYMRNDGTKGMKGLRKIPAPIPEEKTEEIRELALKVFKILDCAGLARIDFLIEKESMKVYVNEINTIPGSFAFYLWEPMGISFKDLIDRLIGFALKRHEDYKKNIYTFDTRLLMKASRGGLKDTKNLKNS